MYIAQAFHELCYYVFMKCARIHSSEKKHDIDCIPEAPHMNLQPFLHMKQEVFVLWPSLCNLVEIKGQAILKGNQAK